MSKDVFILGGKRTPMGEYVGVLKDVSAIDLGAVAARGALEATHVQPDEIDHTVIGNALQTSGDAIYGARHVALKAGVPFDRAALTVNRLCGSGIQSIVFSSAKPARVWSVVWSRCRRRRTSFVARVPALRWDRENSKTV
jgi:acetyl-CoA acetyltransferase